MPEIKVALMTGTGQGIGRGCAIEMAKGRLQGILHVAVPEEC